LLPHLFRASLLFFFKYFRDFFQAEYFSEGAKFNKTEKGLLFERITNVKKSLAKLVNINDQYLEEDGSSISLLIHRMNISNSIMPIH
jgi:hypothetical protein